MSTTLLLTERCISKVNHFSIIYFVTCIKKIHSKQISVLIDNI